MRTILRYLLLCLLLTCFGVGKGQLWQGVGGGFDNSTYSLFPDTLEGKLYVAGDFNTAGNTPVCQIAAWDGAMWNKVGINVGDTSCNFLDATVTSIVKHGPNLYASGAWFGFQGSSNIQYIMKWDNNNWDTLSQPDCGGWLEITNGQLFAMGRFQELNGNPIGWILRRNAFDQWEPFCNSPSLLQGDGYVASSEYYQGRYFFAGNYELPNGYKEIASCDGTQWRSLGVGIPGDTWVNKLKVFHGQLFVGGEFYASVDFPSAHLAAWDGQQWHNPLPLVQYTSQVRDMQIIDGRLFILGRHLVWNGSNWQGPYQIAHYDGQEFCSFGGMDIFPRDVASLHGQLYVTTSYYNQPDPFRFIAKWIGGDSTDICISQPVRIQDQALTENPTISLYPNPTNSFFTLTLPPNTSTCTLKIHDITGREVASARTYRAGDPSVDVTHLSAGLYFVEVRVKDRVEVVKLVKEN